MSQREMTRPYIPPDGNTNSSYEVLLPKEKKKNLMNSINLLQEIQETEHVK